MFITAGMNGMTAPKRHIYTDLFHFMFILSIRSIILSYSSYFSPLLNAVPARTPCFFMLKKPLRRAAENCIPFLYRACPRTVSSNLSSTSRIAGVIRFRHSAFSSSGTP